MATFLKSHSSCQGEPPFEAAPVVQPCFRNNDRPMNRCFRHPFGYPPTWAWICSIVVQKFSSGELAATPRASQSCWGTPLGLPSRNIVSGVFAPVVVNYTKYFELQVSLRSVLTGCSATSNGFDGRSRPGAQDTFLIRPRRTSPGLGFSQTLVAEGRSESGMALMRGRRGKKPQGRQSFRNAAPHFWTAHSGRRSPVSQLVIHERWRPVSGCHPLRVESW
jgi:hypothetical protein